jgi:hypothetical protein
VTKNARQRSRGRRRLARGEEGSIGGLKLRAPNLAAQDRELVAKDDDLELFELLRARAQRDELDEPT